MRESAVCDVPERSKNQTSERHDQGACGEPLSPVPSYQAMHPHDGIARKAIDTFSTIAASSCVTSTAMRGACDLMPRCRPSQLATCRLMKRDRSDRDLGEQRKGIARWKRLLQRFVKLIVQARQSGLSHTPKLSPQPQLWRTFGLSKRTRRSRPSSTTSSVVPCT